MTRAPRSRLGVLLAALTLLAACVTVNIYFPAAKVQKTADEIVSDVYGTDQDKAPEKKPGQGDSSSLEVLLAWLGPQTAHAADAQTISNASIRGLKDEIASRHGQLVKYYNQGKVGITNTGYVAVRDTGGLNVQEVAEVRRLVDADNNARRRLYQEVAKALEQPGEVGQVEKIFAQTWRSKAAGGWWVQEDNGSWHQK